MYQKIFQVTISEDKTYVPKKICYYLGDANSSVLRVKVLQNGRPFKIDPDCQFRICVDTTPNISREEDKVIITQDDQSYVEVNSEIPNVVNIKLGEEIMNYEGVDMPTHIVIYSKDMTSEVKFDPFFINIEKNIHDC